MNIRNRLQKLENGVLPTISGCQCLEKSLMASVSKIYGDDFNESDLLPETFNPLTDSTCPKCQRQVETQAIKLYRNIEFIYGAN